MNRVRVRCAGWRSSRWFVSARVETAAGVLLRCRCVGRALMSACVRCGTFSSRVKEYRDLPGARRVEL